MFCRFCGQKLEIKDGKCTNCGHEITPLVSARPLTLPGTDSTVSSEVKTEKDSSELDAHLRSLEQQLANAESEMQEIRDASKIYRLIAVCAGILALLTLLIAIVLSVSANKKIGGLKNENLESYEEIKKQITVLGQNETDISGLDQRVGDLESQISELQKKVDLIIEAREQEEEQETEQEEQATGQEEQATGQEEQATGQEEQAAGQEEQAAEHEEQTPEQEGKVPLISFFRGLSPDNNRQVIKESFREDN